MPLQIVLDPADVISGSGFTVTVIVKGVPIHVPVTGTGVTIYFIVPAVELFGLVSTWLIVLPEPARPPVIFPVIVPIVQLNVLGILDVKGIFTA